MNTMAKGKIGMPRFRLLTVKAFMDGCMTKTPLIEAYAGKTVISPQVDPLFYRKDKVDQNPPVSNHVWKKQQDQDEIIAEIKTLLKVKN